MTQTALGFGAPTEALLPFDGEAVLYRDAIAPADREPLFERLQQTLPWKSQAIFLYGRWVNQPRLVAWHGDPGQSYRYSGIELQPEPWTPELSALRDLCQTLAGSPFNSVLANLYRTGLDSMGWHADDERELGPNPVIASVSLGQERRFDLRHRATGQTVRTLLPSGSVLVMAGATQHHWVHQVPRTTRTLQPRINLTFRLIRGR